MATHNACQSNIATQSAKNEGHALPWNASEEGCCSFPARREEAIDKLHI